jgi:hypothetical protein
MFCVQRILKVFRSEKVGAIKCDFVDCDASSPDVILVSAAVGENVKLRCNTNADVGVDWMLQSFSSSKWINIYKNGEIYENFKSRFNATSSGHKLQEMSIDNVLLDDTGYYICRELVEPPVDHLIFLHVTGRLVLAFSSVAIKNKRIWSALWTA